MSPHSSVAVFFKKEENAMNDTGVRTNPWAEFILFLAIVLALVSCRDSAPARSRSVDELRKPMAAVSWPRGDEN